MAPAAQAAKEALESKKQAAARVMFLEGVATVARWSEQSATAVKASGELRDEEDGPGKRVRGAIRFAEAQARSLREHGRPATLVRDHETDRRHWTTDTTATRANDRDIKPGLSAADGAPRPVALAVASTFDTYLRVLRSGPDGHESLDAAIRTFARIAEACESKTRAAELLAGLQPTDAGGKAGRTARWTDGIRASRDPDAPVIVKDPQAAARAVTEELNSKLGPPAWDVRSAQDLRDRMPDDLKAAYEPKEGVDPGIYRARAAGPLGQTPAGRALCDPIEPDEVRATLRTMPHDSAPGESGVTAAMLDALAADSAEGRPDFVAALAALLEGYRKDGDVPEGEKRVRVAFLRKVERSTELREVTGRLFYLLLARRLERTLREHGVLHEAQHGFLGNRRVGQCV